MTKISDLEKDIDGLTSQDDVSDHTEALIAKLSTSRDLPVDLCVASLLRILSINSKLVYNSSHRRIALNMVLNRLEKTAPSVLKNYKINRKSMADETCNKLANIELDAMESLEQSLDQYNGIDRLVDFRQQLLKGINHKIVKVALLPFLNIGGDPTIVLNKCFEKAIDYAKAHPEKARESFEISLGELEEVISLFKTYPSKPGTRISNILQKLHSDISNHFVSSSYSKNAELSIIPSHRKYPFHIPDHELSLFIEIKNIGEGVALDVAINLTDALGLISFETPSRVSDINPGQMMTVEILVKTDPDAIDIDFVATCEFDLSWVNTDGTNIDQKTTLEIEAQDHNIMWDNLRESNPYNLVAVTNEDNLIGRSEILEKLEKKLVIPPTGSCIIYGQKRVGKTSLARVALNRIQETKDIVCIYRDVGTLGQTDSVKAIDKLTERLLQDLQAKIPLAKQNKKINKDGSLSPLIDRLEKLQQSSMRIIFAIDEFDELPTPLLSGTDISKTFFRALRSISNMDGIGLILIGGERMDLIINGTPDVFLNSFDFFQLDKLDRETHWSDFENLVRQPAEDYLDYSDKSYMLIYEYTGGNPYYTKLLCDKILDRAAKRRDSFVDEREVNNALEELFRDINSTRFAHYWADYILEDELKQQEIITLNRKRCLIAFGRASDMDYRASLESISKEPSVSNMDIRKLEDIFDEFIRRSILRKCDEFLEPSIKLFGHWIANKGQVDIMVSKSELDFVQNVEAERESLRVAFEEVDYLVKNWDTYKGESITVERVLNYLRQFDTLQSQRIVFTILKNLCFLGGSAETKMWKQAYEELQYSLKKQDNTWQRKQIRISYFGDVGKSSNAMARSFASANKFLKDKRGILRPSQIKESYDNGVSDIVVCDDFVGTGQTLLSDLDRLSEFVMPEQRVHVFILSGMADGIDKITHKAYEIFGNRINLRCLHELNSNSNIFTKIFTSMEEAESAERLLRDVGSRLEPRHPIGYGDCCSLITFQRTIPNNAPPILWKESTGDFNFQPLFPRL